MSETSVTAACPNCGATYSPPASVCWLCKKNLPTDAPASVGSLDRKTLDPGEKFSFTFSIASILLATTLIAVFFGVLTMAPGLAILLAILSVPAFVRTGLAVHRRSQIGKPVSPASKALWFLGSLTVTTVVVTLVIVASVGTFCAVCLGGAGVMNDPNKPVPFAFLAAGITTVIALTLSVRWIRRRWRRDVGG